MNSKQWPRVADFGTSDLYVPFNARGLKTKQTLPPPPPPEASEGLLKAQKEQEEREVIELNEIYRPLEADLLEVILAQLRNGFGDRWFIDGVPLSVKQKGIAEQDEDKSKSYEECFTLPTDAKLIMDSHKQDFQDLMQVGDLRWMNKLIELRIGISHAPYKVELHYRDFLENTVRPIVDRAKKKLEST